MSQQTESNILISDQTSFDRLAALVTNATSEVFSTMLDMPLAAGEARRRQHDLSDHFNGVIAVVGLAGEWIGSGGLCCSEDVACKIAAQLLMTEFPAVDREVIDAMGEVANIIVGNVKNELEETMGVLQLSLPTVIHGTNLNTSSGKDQEWTVVEFSGDLGTFSVHLSLQRNTAAQ
jgi:chemotaxis protein CheX